MGTCFFLPTLVSRLVIGKNMKVSLFFAIVGIALTSAKVVDVDLDLQKIYENVKNEMEGQVRSAEGYKFTSHSWRAKKDYPSEMSKRNKIFRNIRAHLKKEFDLDDATARSFAKQALTKYRSSGSKAIERTSPYCTTDLPAITCDSTSKYRTIEGLCNNLNSPYLGSFDAAFIREREVDPYFAKDITISDPTLPSMRQNNNNNNNNNNNANNGCEWRDTLPSARTVSHLFHNDHDAPSPDVTHMVTQWGQFLDHDVTGTPEFHDPDDCCAEPDREECINISVGDGLDSFYNPLGVTCLSLHRSEPFCEENEDEGVTREHFNINTHYVDASNVYGHDDETAESLRSFEDGLLLVEETLNLLPEDPDNYDYEFAGDFRAREMPGLLSMHTLFVREHNRLAGLIKNREPNFSDEEIYQEARRINVAQYQSVVYGGYLPVVLGTQNIDGLELDRDGSDYDSSVDPTMTTEFATAAYRFGHSMIQGLVERFKTDNSGLFDNYLLHDVFFTTDVLKQNNGGQLGFEQILMGLVTQAAQICDKEVTAETTNLLFAGDADFGGDLIARNIQRGRDHGIPGFCCYYQLYVDSDFDCDEGWNDRYDDISQDNWSLL